MEFSAIELRRFWGKVAKQPGEDGCWLWTAGAWSSGEPAVFLNGRIRSARRIAYALCHHIPYPYTTLRTYPPCFSKRCLRHLTIPSTIQVAHISPRTIQRFWKYVTPAPTLDGCSLWHGTCDTRGYPYFQTEGKRWRIPQIAWIIQHGPLPLGFHAIRAIGCENPLCITHLVLSLKKSVHLRINHTHAKLTPGAVVAMRADHATHAYTLRMLADKYGLTSLGQVCDIVHHRSWTRIP